MPRTPSLHLRSRSAAPGTQRRRMPVLRRLLAVAVVGVSALATANFTAGAPLAFDLTIPLRAAERWLAGDQPYSASSFAIPPGDDLPFLYPPYTLPAYAILTVLPRLLLLAVWVSFLATVAIATCRRLGFPDTWIFCALIWPPFSEAIYVGNIQILLFATFVWLMVPIPAGPATDPINRSPLARGTLAAIGAGFKVSQPHVVLHKLRWDRRAGIVAIGLLVAIAIATLPLTGIQTWFDYLEQLLRASDPAWFYGGLSLARFIPPEVLAVVLAIGVVAAIVIRPSSYAAAWLGLALVIGAPRIHPYYLLFLLPAMLTIRREIALFAALCFAPYIEPLLWLGIAIVGIAMVASSWVPGLRERRDGSTSDPRPWDPVRLDG